MNRGAQRWLTMGSLCFAGGSIYTLPYLYQIHEPTLREVLQLGEGELGVLLSVYGWVAMICYFPGGWLADRLSARRLLSVSLMATGLLGIVYADFPSYGTLLAVHALWGVTGILTFWAALIKATRAWAGPDEQGRAFGLLEGGRGIFEALLTTAATGLFIVFAQGAMGLKAAIWFFSGVSIGGSLLVWRFAPEDGPPSRDRTPRQGRRAILRVLSMPVVWLHALVIFVVYAAAVGSNFLAAFARQVFEQEAGVAAMLGTMRLWLRPVGAIVAGFIADRVSASKAVSVGLVVLACAYAALAILPPDQGMVPLLWIDTVIVALAVFALRGIYFALMEEGRVPMALTGTAVGIVSVLGYSADALLPPVRGWLIDTAGELEGYRLLFTGLSIGAVVGLAATQGIRLLGAMARRRERAARDA